MDLYSGLPYWIVKNKLYDYFQPLETNRQTDVVIIGTGITGSLVAHELCKAGLACTILDKRTPSTGSSSASTALLQYEIDTPLHQMAGDIGEENAVLAYHCCLDAITDLEQIFREIGKEADFMRVPSLYYASDKEGEESVEKEYKIRTRHGLPVSFLNREQIKKRFGFDAGNGLYNTASAQVDAYLASTCLLEYHLEHSGLRLYTHTTVTECTRRENGFVIHTENGPVIQCRYVVIAAGFESGKFLPRPVMQLTSTYALVSEPVKESLLWEGKSLIWETRDPYIYIRTTAQNRIMVGGEDETFSDPVKRDELLRAKTARLEEKFRHLFPQIPLKTEMAWCGTFSSTEDGLPFIGEWPGEHDLFYALGYGGNGITFSVNAAQMIRKRIEGKEDSRFKVYGFEREMLRASSGKNGNEPAAPSV